MIGVALVAGLHVAVLASIWLFKGPPPWRFESVPAPVQSAAMVYLRYLAIFAWFAVIVVAVVAPFMLAVTVPTLLVRAVVRSVRRRREATGGLPG